MLARVRTGRCQTRRWTALLHSDERQEYSKDYYKANRETLLVKAKERRYASNKAAQAMYMRNYRREEKTNTEQKKEVAKKFLSESAEGIKVGKVYQPT